MTAPTGRPPSVPWPDGPVPLAAAFAAPRWAPWWALAWTDVLARLTLRPDGFERRVIRRRHASYGEVDLVDAAEVRGGVTVTLALSGRWFAFVALIRNRSVAARLVARFAAEGRPLGEGARRLLASA